MKRNNQPMYGETLFVSYTVCVNHVVEKVVSSPAAKRIKEKRKHSVALGNTLSLVCLLAMSSSGRHQRNYVRTFMLCAELIAVGCPAVLAVRSRHSGYRSLVCAFVVVRKKLPGTRYYEVRDWNDMVGIVRALLSMLANSGQLGCGWYLG